jgi:hypothetical protein
MKRWFAAAAMVIRAVYVLFECDCDWNQEDGLQIVFKHGNQVSKVGPFDDF